MSDQKLAPQQQFFARYHVMSAADDLPWESETLVSPTVTTEPPVFADTLPLTKVMDDDCPRCDPEPEWLQDFDPWVLESIREYEQMEAI